MIEIKNITKSFGTKTALNNINFEIHSGNIIGLIGSNGAGKSTLLRIMSGVYKADMGEIIIDAQNPYENNYIKEKTLFISDNPYYAPQDSIKGLSKFYKSIYKDWDDEQYKKLLKTFPIDEKKKISTMSKGMQRQAALILGFAHMPKYIFFDEIFDGLDPVVREMLKRIIIEFVSDNDATVIISSHNLRELEDVCDHVALLHCGGIVFASELDELKLGIYNVHAVFNNDDDFLNIKSKLNIIKYSEKGRVIEFTVKGEKCDIVEAVEHQQPIFSELLPLTLEEVFISEMEVAGYEVGK